MSRQVFTSAFGLMDDGFGDSDTSMTSAQIFAIANPTNGQEAYASDMHTTWVYDGQVWRSTGGIGMVYNAATGKIWMDRNLGAERVAVAANDTNSYGYLYQWGRAPDGHHCRGSAVTSTRANNPAHNKFIQNTTAPYDWRTSQNDGLWQGVNAINAVCPDGFRLPTEAEWIAEIDTWASGDVAGAFASPLKLSVGGYRYHNTGAINYTGTRGAYWSSTVDGTQAQYLLTLAANTYMSAHNRARGFSVRCIKD